MKTRFSIAILGLLALVVAFCLLLKKKNQPQLAATFISFTESMKKADPAFGSFACPKKVQQQWKILEKLYNHHLSLPPTKTRIPKIIHQIWLGGALPQKYYAMQKTWQEHHPDWEYRLWTDADLPTFPFSDRERFEKAKNKGEQADILRYEILYRYGGLYVDTDFECLKPHDLFHEYCDFYAGLMAASPGKKQRPEIGNALIGSVAGHPIFKYCLEKISKRETGGDPEKILKITGPQCLTKAFLHLHNKGEYRNVIFPFTYFYPWPGFYRDQPELKQSWIQEESYSVHCWHVSWLTPK